MSDADHIQSRQTTNNFAHGNFPFSGYTKFRECVNEPLGRECGAKARNLMHHSLAFLMQKCESQLDLGQFAGARSCPPLAAQRSLEPPTSLPDPAADAGRGETETDYFLNEKPADARLTDDRPNQPAGEHFVTDRLSRSNQTVGAEPAAAVAAVASGEEEPLAENLTKRLEGEETDDESAEERPSVAHVQHSTESPQFVRYDARADRSAADGPLTAPLLGAALLLLAAGRALSRWAPV